MNKRSSLRKKLMLIFGLLCISLIIILGTLAIVSARNLLISEAEENLQITASFTAIAVSEKFQKTMAFLHGMTGISELPDEMFSPDGKSLRLRSVSRPKYIRNVSFADTKGNLHLVDKTINVSKQEWYPIVMSGKDYFSEPFISAANGELLSVFAVPVFDKNKRIAGAINANVSGLLISETLSDILKGRQNAAYGFIVSKTGRVIGALTAELVVKKNNIIEEAKSVPNFENTARFVFLKEALDGTVDHAVGSYKRKSENGTEHFIAAYAKVPGTDWTVIIESARNISLKKTKDMQRLLLLSGALMAGIILFLIFIVAQSIINPIRNVLKVAKNIARGDGDLTVRLPVQGNDEITDMAMYFNETISKIADSVSNVSKGTATMQGIGTELSTNMSETASSIHQISANIEGLKQQAMTQATSITETSSTVEEIIRTIRNLNNSIEAQAASVAQSSSSVEEMVSNIASIMKNLERSNEAIAHLDTATDDGKESVNSATSVVQKITEESGFLLETSNVIQNIAEQTNLLAMNAAIEAAHAGESGKGFAVVADEIRKLAEDSSAQGKTITETLKKLESEIEAVSESARLVEEKFNIIFELSSEVKKMSDTIDAAMREQESGSREVLKAIKNINAVTLEVKDGSAEMLKGGEQVANEMRKLDDLTRVVSDSMNEMSAGASQINNAVQEVNLITQRNKESIDALSAEVGKFKV